MGTRPPCLGKKRGEENVAPVSPKLAPRVGDSNQPVSDWTRATELDGRKEDQAVIVRVRTSDSLINIPE